MSLSANNDLLNLAKQDLGEATTAAHNALNRNARATAALGVMSTLLGEFRLAIAAEAWEQSSDFVSTAQTECNDALSKLNQVFEGVDSEHGTQAISLAEQSKARLGEGVWNGRPNMQMHITTLTTELAELQDMTTAMQEKLRAIQFEALLFENELVGVAGPSPNIQKMQSYRPPSTSDEPLIKGAITEIEAYQRQQDQ